MKTFKKIIFLFFSIILLCGCFGNDIKSAVEKTPVSLFCVSSSTGNTLIDVLKNSKLISNYKIDIGNQQMIGGIQFVPANIYMDINKKFIDLPEKFKDFTLQIVLSMPMTQLREEGKYNAEDFNLSTRFVKNGKVGGEKNQDEIKKKIMKSICNNSDIVFDDLYHLTKK